MSQPENIIPVEFIKVMKDFMNDLKTTFPEYAPLIQKWYPEDESKIDFSKLFAFCQKKVAPCFFDILYQNEDIFKEDSTIDTEFLPNIYFKNIWNFDISQQTKDTLWKYLQLILFSIVGSLENKECFGDSAKLFEAINETEFQNKMKETFEKMGSFFEGNTQTDTHQEDGQPESQSSSSQNGMPNLNNINEHINEILGSKIGNLAKEIAEETAQDLNMNLENTLNMTDLFKNLMKNPKKFTDIFKKVENKISEKINSGELKQSELMEEASDLINKMGMGEMGKMFANMAGGKINVNAMSSELNKQMKLEKQKEKMRERFEASQKEKVNIPTTSGMVYAPKYSEEELIKCFSVGEKPEKTARPMKKKGKKSKK
jgi:hypothetical protein